jgi:hypothetical protein
VRNQTKPQSTDAIRSFARDLAGGLGKVPGRFVEDAVAAIWSARSVRLTDMAAALGEEITHRATHKRLSRNLPRSEVRDAVNGRLLELGARRVRRNTRIIVHVRHLNKKYARKMQYLYGAPIEEPTENSVSHSAEDGYRVCEVLACETGSQHFTPLTAHLWSPNAPGYVDDCAEVMSTVNRVREATNGRGVLYHDESLPLHGASVHRILQEDSLNAVLVGELPWANEWIYQGRLTSAHDLVAQCDLPYAKTVYKRDPRIDEMERNVICLFGSMQVRHPQHPDRPLTMIVVSADGPSMRDTPVQTQLFLCTAPLRPNRKVLFDILAGSMKTMEVVEANLAHKAEYDVTGFRVLTYDRLQTLMSLLQACAFFEAAITRKRKIEFELARMTPHPGNHRRHFLLPNSAAG